jgi:hypothetical protein
MMETQDVAPVGERARVAYAPTTDLSHEAVDALTRALRPLLADVFALYPNPSRPSCSRSSLCWPFLQG